MCVRQFNSFLIGEGGVNPPQCRYGDQDYVLEVRLPIMNLVPSRNSILFKCGAATPLGGSFFIFQMTKIYPVRSRGRSK